MDMKSGLWPASDHTLLASTPRDCILGPPANQQRDCQQQPRRLSFLQESGWQQQYDDGFERSNDITSNDFDMFGSSVTSPTLFPRQSIEQASDPLQIQQPLPETSRVSPDFPGDTLDQNYAYWPAPVTHPVPIYPPPIPENCQWSIPPSFNEPIALNGLPVDVQPHLGPSNEEIMSQAMHFAPPRHLRYDSPFAREHTEIDWDMTDGGQMTADTTSDELTESESSGPCYAQLLYRCLKEAQGHTLSLRDLYKWVSEHSQKAKDPKSKGWQNSVRHNLSMNAAFERVHPVGITGVKKGSLWRLTESALREGVISTTRYRKDPKRKSDRRIPPALKRQISGAKGGQATRNATRRQQALHQARSHPNMPTQQYHHRPLRRQYDSSFFSPTPLTSEHGSPRPILVPPQQAPSPYFVHYDERSSMPPSSSIKPSPQQFQAMYNAPARPASIFGDFQQNPFEYFNCGLVGNTDDMDPDTPSLATEASFVTDDGSQISPSASREMTTFL